MPWVSFVEFYEFLKACEWFCMKPIFWRKTCKHLTILGCPRNVYRRFMYIAPSCRCSLMNPNLPYRFILRRLEVAFWCLEWECCTFFSSNPPVLYFSSNIYVRYETTWIIWIWGSILFTCLQRKQAVCDKWRCIWLARVHPSGQSTPASTTQAAASP